MNVPVFIDISLEDQAEELRVYFKSLGAEISAERSEKGIEDDLHKGPFTCDVCPEKAGRGYVIRMRHLGVLHGKNNVG